jgi:alginate O-acetyltransferase complex protein AlgI
MQQGILVYYTKYPVYILKVFVVWKFYCPVAYFLPGCTLVREVNILDFHGLFLVIDKLGWDRISRKLPAILNIAITFLLVTIGWVFFRAETLPEAWLYLDHMFNPKWMLSCSDVLIFRGDIIHNRAVFTLCIALAITFFPNKIVEQVKEDFAENPNFQSQTIWLQGTAVIIFLILSAATLGGSSYSPFLYFRF